jgi:hypothetical protein
LQEALLEHEARSRSALVWSIMTPYCQYSGPCHLDGSLPVFLLHGMDDLGEGRQDAPSLHPEHIAFDEHPRKA